LVNVIPSCGDYRLQNSICETLYRLTPTTESTKKQFIDSIFSKFTNYKKLFSVIRPKSFEEDCRAFLNYVNQQKESK